MSFEFDTISSGRRRCTTCTTLHLRALQGLGGQEAALCEVVVPKLRTAAIWELCGRSVVTLSDILRSLCAGCKALPGGFVSEWDSSCIRIVGYKS